MYNLLRIFQHTVPHHYSRVWSLYSQPDAKWLKTATRKHKCHVGMGFPSLCNVWASPTNEYHTNLPTHSEQPTSREGMSSSADDDCVCQKRVFCFKAHLSHLLSSTLTAAQLPVEEGTRLSLHLAPSLSVCPGLTVSVLNIASGCAITW